MDSAQNPILVAAAIIALILLLLFAGFVVIVVRFQRQIYRARNKALAIKLETLEQERLRIARDLHDELSPMLTRVFSYVNVCGKRYGPQVAAFLNPANETLDILIARVREIIKNLDHERILQRGLAASVQEVLVQYQELQVLDYTFTYTVKQALPGPVTIGLYRIFMELIQNTIKHAQASAVSLTIWQWRSFLFFSYTDNGVPMPAEPVSKGLGLESLRLRIELLGGCSEQPASSEKIFQFHIPLPSI